MKGPDVMSKSEWTQSHYRAQSRNQTLLSSFGFTQRVVSLPQSNHSQPAAPDESQSPRCPSVISVSSEEGCISTSPSLQYHHANLEPVSKRKCHSLAPSEEDEPSMEEPGSELDDISVEGSHCASEMDKEEWEEELDFNLVGHSEVRNWTVLHDQIKEDLKKYKSLPLSSVNQLMILSNFATLRLKGASRMAASFDVA